MYCKYMELAGLKKQQLIFKNNYITLAILNPCNFI